MSPEQSVGHYRIVSKLGEGGMGVVYRARDTILNRDVAIKVLPPALTDDADRMARFKREAQVLASLNHPNIAVIYGVEQAAIVMELVEGENLQTPVPLATALDYACQIAEALEAAHEKGIIHRDLKPANIKVTPAGVVKVLDFGLAKTAEATSGTGSASISPTMTFRATQAGIIMGTAGYMAPEQAAGKPVDRRADIWSFGVVLYEMLSGSRLFDRETVAHTMADVLTKEIDLSSIEPGLRPLVRRCLQRDPRKRLRDIGDARLAIEEYLAIPPLASPAIPMPVRSSRIAWIIAGILAAALIPASIGSFHRTAEPLKPLLRFEINLGPDASPSTIMRSLAISPDGMRLAYGTRSADSTLRISVRSLDQQEGALIAGSEGGSLPFFSPDSQWLGFLSGGKLKKVDLHGGSPSDILSLNLTLGASWGEDGNIVIVPSVRSPLTVISAAGGAPLPLIPLDHANKEVTQRNPQLIPGGNVVLFTSNSHGGNYEDADIVALDRKSSQRKVLHRGGFFPKYLGPATGPGYLLYLRESVMYAMPMDPERLTVIDPPVPVLPGITTVPNGGYAPLDVSRNGTVVFLKGTGVEQATLQFVDPTGRATQVGHTGGLFSGVRVSPDGRRLIFFLGPTDQRDLWVQNLERDTATKMTFDGKAGPVGIWSPDSKHVMYTSQGKAWWIRSDGSGQPQMVMADANPESISPDGKRILLSRLLPSGSDLLTAAIEENGDLLKVSQPKRFFSRSPVDSQAEISPDGRWVAYQTTEAGGRPELFVRPFSDVGGRWQASSHGGSMPAWSRSELLYMDGTGRLMAVPYTSKGDAFVAGTERVWWDGQIRRVTGGRNYDITLDGKHVVAVQDANAASGAKAPGQITVLLNFYDELVRRIPPK